MSRANTLIYRLERMGNPSVNEQDPTEGQESDDNDAMIQQQQGNDDENIDPTMDSSDSPFSRATHNSDGSLKVDQTDQSINDKGRFIVRRRR